MARTARAHPKDQCERASEHTPEPRGYIEWHEWAEEKAKTHRQVRCEGCGLFAIWVPKGRAGLNDKE